MVAQGTAGPWRPRGSGLLVAVVAVSVVALVVHGIVTLTLLNGAANPGSDGATDDQYAAPTSAPRGSYSGATSSRPAS